MRIDNVRGLKYSLLQGKEEDEYPALCCDTRKVEPGCLFVCVTGSGFDPHDHLEEIKAAGAAGIVVEKTCAFPDGINVFSVNDSREALAYLSAAYFKYPEDEINVIAVTGTKGKTTTACMIKKLIDDAGRPYGYKCGYIGTIGIAVDDTFVPIPNTTPDSFTIHKTLRDMADHGCTCVVMEVSSQAIKMRRVAGMHFDIGLFTNLSSDHIGPGEHESFQEYLDCKTQIIGMCRKALLNGDDQYSEYVRENSWCKETLSFGSGDGCNYRLIDTSFVTEDSFIGLDLNISVPGRERHEISAKVGIPGDFNAMNALGAIAICSEMGVPEDILCESLKDVSIKGRMETVYSDSDVKVIVDFAHNEVSMQALLETLRAYEPKRLVVVFGCGGNRSKERRYGMGRVAAQMADFSVLTEDNSRFEDIADIIADIKSVMDPAGGKYAEIPVREDAVYYALENRQPGDIIAIIGKGHEDYKEIRGVKTHYTDQEAVYAALKKLGIGQQGTEGLSLEGKM